MKRNKTKTKQIIIKFDIIHENKFIISNIYVLWKENNIERRERERETHTDIHINQ